MTPESEFFRFLKLMGRQTWIHQCHMLDDSGYDTDGDYAPIQPSKKFIKKMEDKYKAEFNWKFGQEWEDDNEIYYCTKLWHSRRVEFPMVDGEIDDIVKQLLEVGKKYKRNFGGNFCYTDDQSGGSFSGIVYIDQDSAKIYEFDTDAVAPDKSAPTIRDVRLDAKKSKSKKVKAKKSTN